jgi:predicted heme/steroid binding protein
MFSSLNLITYFRYNQIMENPDRVVSFAELRRNNGERGSRKYIAYQGLVYDVSDCPRWSKELHERMHFSGLDLSGEMEDAPHKEDVFSRPCVILVGRLQT